MGRRGYTLPKAGLRWITKTALQEDGRILVEATVSDTADLRWWLLGFGSSVEVLEPTSLREQFREQAQRLLAHTIESVEGVLRPNLFSDRNDRNDRMVHLAS